VELLQNGRIGFGVYCKKSGGLANDCLDCQSEQEAMDRALDWMRHGTWMELDPSDRITEGTKLQREPSDRSTEATPTKATPTKAAPTKATPTKATPINHLPLWSQKLIQEHRLQRSSLNAKPGEPVWTRASNGELVTELDLYWSLITAFKDGQFTYYIYSKKSGVAAHYSDCRSEQEAMDQALDWMRHLT